ncbi:MAG: hypothetical protein RR701_07380 [Comamonas sp.]
MSTDLSCPTCGSEFDLATVFASECDQQALARLVAVSFPIGTRVLQYVGLHQPAKQRLTAAKKIKLLLQLLPDLEREAIHYKGRDWRVPLNLWSEAIDQMLAKRDTQRIELPLKGHGYLYAVLAGLSSDHEAAAERQREAELRNAGRAHSSASPTSVGDLLQNPAPRPQMAPAQPAGMSPTVRAMRAAIEKKQGA